MNIHVAAIGNHPLAATVHELGARHGSRHAVVDSAEEADLVLLCGSFAHDPAQLTTHPLYLALRDKCAVYSGDDAYLPIAPGVYTSPRRGLSTSLGRVRSHGYVSSYGIHGNEAVSEASAALGDDSAGAHGRDKDLLFSFEGTPSSRVRRRLLGLALDPAEAVVRDSSSSYRHFDHSAPGRLSGQRRYVETMMRSRFSVCPRGVGTGTLRLFEAMSLGVAPVLVSDRYVLPRGPRWDDFLLKVPERNVHRLPAILRGESTSSAERGVRARRQWRAWFASEVIFDGVVDAAAEALHAGATSATVYRALLPLALTDLRFRRRLRKESATLLGRARTSSRRGP